VVDVEVRAGLEALCQRRPKTPTDKLGRKLESQAEAGKHGRRLETP
jgi:hypothetical protein